MLQMMLLLKFLKKKRLKANWFSLAAGIKKITIYHISQFCHSNLKTFFKKVHSLYIKVVYITQKLLIII